MKTPTTNLGESRSSLPKPRFLVLMAVRNGAKWIGPQVRSIVGQTHVDTTLVICDDDSDDASIEIAKREATVMPLQIVQSLDRGGSAGRNFFRLMDAVDVAAADFVALADQDDIWAPEKLHRAASLLASTGASGYSASVTAVWEHGKHKLLGQSPRIREADFLFEGAGQGCTFVMRAEIFAQLQSAMRVNREHLQSIHYHDWTIYALCRTLGHRWVFDSTSSMQYRQHGGNDTGARTGSAGIRKRLSQIRSGWYGGQVDAITRLCLAVTQQQGHPSQPALRYLSCADAADRSLRHRLALANFTWRHGRRRFLDRLVVGIATLAGYMTPTSRGGRQ